MSEESWPEGLTVVAEGRSAGLKWIIRAGGTRDDCTTVLNIELPDGSSVGGGGFGGPALHIGRLTNMSVHRVHPQIHCLVGRVHPSVALVRLELTGVQPTMLDLSPVGEHHEFGVLFVAGILPTTADLVNITAWDSDGKRLEDEDTRQAESFLRGSRPRPLPGNDAVDHHLPRHPS